MEKAETKFKFKCPKHPDFKIEFLKIDGFDSSTQKNDNVLNCYACFNKDPHFKWSNYQLIKEIIKSGQDQMIASWPPQGDSKIVEELIEILRGEEETQLIVDYIMKYFAELQANISKQIDICQKKMIQFVQELPENKTDIMKKYQELSRINELRSVFVSDSSDIHEKESQCRGLVENILSQKLEINKQLSSLLNQHSINIFDPDVAIQIEESILKKINSIDFFESLYIPFENCQIQDQDIKLVKTYYKDSQINQCLSTNKYNEQQLTITNSILEYQNTVSNTILNRNQNYIFRIKFKNIDEGDDFAIGLMQDCNINSKPGNKDTMHICLQYVNNQISIRNQNSPIKKQIKGDGFILSNSNTIEMRVCIQDQILEVLDYPHYRYHVGISDQRIDKLKLENLRLYIGMKDLNNTMILQEALVFDKLK